MAMPTHFQVINPPVQNPMGGANFHTPPSIFQHMMGQQNVPHPQGSWPQMPQVPPMYMPWSVPSLQQSQLVRFTGEQPSTLAAPLQQKRKCEVVDVTSPRPRKQFISEEKMAAHFRDMHISSNFNLTPVASTSRDCQPQPSTSSQVDINVDTNPSNLDDRKTMHPRLVISEEVKRLPQEPLLPASLLSKLERPTMALVLWEPPSKYLLPQLRTHPNNNEDRNNENLNNNNEEIADMNASTFQSSMELEPMDL